LEFTADQGLNLLISDNYEKNMQNNFVDFYLQPLFEKKDDAQH